MGCEGSGRLSGGVGCQGSRRWSGEVGREGWGRWSGGVGCKAMIRGGDSGVMGCEGRGGVG